MKAVGYISFLLVVVASCNLSDFRKIDEDYYIFQDAYGLDSMYMADYLMYGTRKDMSVSVFSRIELNNDSLFQVFKNAVINSSLPVDISPVNHNRMSSALIGYDKMNHRVLASGNLNYIIGVAKQSNHKLVLVPLITKSYVYTDYLGGPECSYWVELYLTIFIVHKNEIIYSKQMSKREESVIIHTHPLDFDYNKIQVPQKYWDGLFRETMREYIERVKWEN